MAHFVTLGMPSSPQGVNIILSSSLMSAPVKAPSWQIICRVAATIDKYLDLCWHKAIKQDNIDTLLT